MYSPDELRRLSQSTISSESTISPKDSILFSTELPETLGYFSQPTPLFKNSPVYETPAPMSPIPPRAANVRPIPRSQTEVKPQKDGEAPQSGPVRRRSTKTSSVATSNTATKSSGVSNHNNSKPMTARDRKRRQMHNASAMRSRIRLNETLDKMWKTIPVSRRRKRLNSLNSEGCEASNDGMDDLDEDEEERIGRADKVEVGIDYIIYLEERVKQLEQRVAGGH